MKSFRGKSACWLLCMYLWKISPAVSGSTTNVFASEDPGVEPDQPNNIWKNRKQQQPQQNPFQYRIIGGTKAKQERFPYIVSLLTEGASQTMAPACGGTLIAPDIVLTANHCRTSRLRTAHVGMSDRTDPNDQFEIFTIEEQISHPKYRDDNLDYDVMLLKLSGQSNNPLVALNRDPTLPSSNIGTVGDELVVLGFGVTQVGGDLSISASNTLQIGTVHHVPNDICEAAKAPGVEETYQGRIKEDMLCAWGDGVDACQGDSGSGLIAQGETIVDDVQVGVTSWGYKCAHPDFPGVYSRVSFFWDWIAAKVCQVSRQPPPGFKCSVMGSGHAASNSSTVEGAGQGGLPQLTLSLPAERLVTVTLRILFDSYASETSWRLKDAHGNLIASLPFGSYIDGRTRAIRTFFLQEGKEYAFTIEDSYRDGLCCSSPGNYMLTVGGEDSGTRRLLVFGKGDFGASATHEFEIPKAGSNDEDATLGNDVAASLQSEEGTVPLRLILQLDDKPYETSWTLERIGFHTEVVARMPSGSYREHGEQVDLFIDLEEDELYRFTVMDSSGNGIDRGRIRLFLGKHGGAEHAVPLLDHDGSFASSFDHSFLASAAKVSDAPVPSEDFLTLEIRMDLYPEEISFQLRADIFVGAVAIKRRASNVVFFRPPRFYSQSHTNQIVRETIPIPLSINPGSLKHFTLIMIDAFGDGLCCRWQGRSSNTGYTLYRGNPDNGDVLVSSSFSSTAREEYSFSMAGTGESHATAVAVGAVPLSVKPIGEVSVRVLLHLDGHPNEIGYAIADVEGRSVVHISPGKLREKNTTFHADHVLDPGVYTFAIVDSHGDGIQRPPNGTAYELVRSEDLRGPPIVAGDGDFETRREHVFVVEGDHASVSLTINLDNSNELFEIGFQVERLDLAEAEAVVATVSPSLDTTITESLLVQSGGLYRLSPLGGDRDNFTGSTRIAIGTNNDFQEVDINHGPKFLVSANSAGSTPQVEPDSDNFLSLSIPSQLNSREIDWVLLAVNVEAWGSEGKAYTKRQVIAFGPSSTKSHENFRNEVETIPLPRFEGKQTFMLIVTHSGAECCAGTAGAGLIQLFRGLPQDNDVLIGTSFEGESRLVEMFNLVGSELQEAKSSSSSSFVGTAIVAGGLVLVSGYVIFRSFASKR